MNKDILQFLKDNKNLLQYPVDKIDWDQVYRKCDYIHRSDLTKMLHSRSIYPEYYLTEIPWYFQGESNEHEITIPNNIENIKDQAYWLAKDVTRIYFNNSHIIDFNHTHNRFQGVGHNTTKCIFEAGPECSYIPARLFVNGHLGQYPRITDIDLTKSNCIRIGELAFYNLQELTNISFNPDLITIEDMAFNGCNSISKLTIPSTVQSVGAEAFSGCYGLRELFISKNTKFGAECFAYGSTKEQLVINFDGTKAEFKQNNVGVFTNTYYICHCADGDIVKKKRQ